jgi:membrane-bound lytic murein transglycosylase D
MTPPARRGLRPHVVLFALLAALAGCATGPTPSPASIAEAPAPAASAAAPDPAPAPAEPALAAVPPGPAASEPDAGEPAPVPTAVDPLHPEVRLDMDDRAARIDLWERVRAGFTLTDLDSDRVREQERWYATRPDYVQRMTERGGRYLFHIVEELDKRGMPMELALLPFIESAFNPEAMSSARASGMWQFIPSTGRDFDLTQNIFRDDRRDVLASTRAALDYLQKLYGMFGDWHLALAAYNWGEGSVQRAIERNRRAGKPTDYTSLRMPRETQYYVPKLQAVKNIVARPADFGLVLPALANHPYFVAVAIERDIDVTLAARLAGMPLDEFKALNPQMNKPVIFAAGTPQVLLPYDNANQFVLELPRHRGPLASWTAWVAPKTLRVSEAAKAVGMSEAELREVNRIPPHMLLKAGSTLLVPRGEHRLADVSLHVADNAMMAFAPEAAAQRRLTLKAGRRDSVASVARRYRVSAAQVAHWNGVSAGSSFRPGEAIIVYVSGKASRPTIRTTAGPRKTAAKPAPARGGKATAARSTKSAARVAKN